MLNVEEKLRMADQENTVDIEKILIFCKDKGGERTVRLVSVHPMLAVKSSKSPFSRTAGPRPIASQVSRRIRNPRLSTE